METKRIRYTGRDGHVVECDATGVWSTGEEKDVSEVIAESKIKTGAFVLVATEKKKEKES